MDLELGEIEGDGPEVFGRILGLLGDASGRIFVADYRAAEVRVFDSNGRHAFTFGRSGSGPGELLGPCCMAWSPDSLLWIRDGSNQRYSSYRVSQNDAVFAATRRMAHGDVNRLTSLTFTGAGELIDVGSRTSPTGALEQVRFVLGPAGDVVRTEVVPTPEPRVLGQHIVEREIEGGRARLFFYPPFAPRHLVAHGPSGRFAFGIGSVYSIQLVSGDSVLELAGDAENLPLSAAELESARSQLSADAERAGVPPGALPYGLPDEKPPIQAIFFDAVGRLWVERTVRDGEPRVADVWGEDGHLLTRVQWPERVVLAPTGWVGADWALGIRRDSLGVEHVVRLRF